MSTASDVKLAGDKSRGSCPTGQKPAGYYGVLGDPDPVGEPALWLTERRKLPKSTTWEGDVNRCTRYGVVPAGDTVKPVLRGGIRRETVIRDKDGRFIMTYASYGAEDAKRIERNRRKAKAAKKARRRNRRR